MSSGVELPTVRIDDEVYQRLQQAAEPFVDTPNSVLRRLLELEPEQTPELSRSGAPTQGNSRPPASDTLKTSRRRKQKRTRVPTGSILAEDEYELPILMALTDAGGAAPSKDVLDTVGEILKDRLTELDIQELSSGGIRWRNRAQFARLKLVERGLLDHTAPRGLWRLTPAGHEKTARFNGAST